MGALPDRSAPPRMADYESEYASFRLEVPDVFNPTIDIVEAWAEREPEALALVSLDGAGGVVAEGTTADLAYESRRCAAPDDAVGNVGVQLGAGRPVGLFDEYVGDEEANAEAFRDGNYYSGDKAWRDGDGYLWFEGRDDDVITSAAYRIGPFEVESALVEHEAVVEAAVVGRADPERTQVVCAFVVLAAGRPGSEELAAELQTHTRELTAPYKYPRQVFFVEELPKTISGKIRRSQLREELAAGKFG
jgi:acyl-coenzyme A synthetase/AMP-(fatty) acid ligase